MKLVRKHIEKDKSGSITLVAEEAEDMWHAYNLLVKGDYLKATTIRRVVSESVTGSTDKSSVRLNLTIQIEDVFFDTYAATLRVNGRNATENEHIKMGQYHTLDLEMNRPFTLTKLEWDVVSLDRVKEACDAAKRAEIAAVVMQEGLSNVCLVTENMTLVRQRIETNVPRKRRGTTTDHDKGMNRFFEQTVQAVLKHVDFSIVKVLIIASPGFVKDAFYKYMLDQALKNGYKSLIENKSKMILLHCSSGQKHALNELLQDPTLQSQLSETKYAKEVKSIERFYKLLGSDPARAFYGYDHVSIAAEKGAIETLMLTDTLFRSNDVSERKKYIRLIELVRQFGGKAFIFSSLHSSGEQLGLLTGVAAILQFPLPDLEEEAEQIQEAKKRQEQGALAPREGDENIAEDLGLSLGH